MAQATRTTPGTSGLSDDPVENMTDWLTANARPVMMGVAGAVILGLGIFGYRYLSESKIAEASAALYKAQGPMLEGKLPEAQAALQQVSTRYGGTGAGQQATILLAQVLYEQKNYQTGVNVLEKAQSDASKQNVAAFNAMTAAGYEGLQNWAKAAEFYAKAADASEFHKDKANYRASQARSLMLAGKTDLAKPIWQELKDGSDAQFAQEARVRLGEIAGAASK